MAHSCQALRYMENEATGPTQLQLLLGIRHCSDLQVTKCLSIHLSVLGDLQTVHIYAPSQHTCTRHLVFVIGWELGGRRNVDWMSLGTRLGNIDLSEQLTLHPIESRPVS